MSLIKSKTKTRKQKAEIYEEKYSDIPKDYQERLSWMYDTYHVGVSKASFISRKYKEFLNEVQYSKEIFVVLYEEPEGSPRPRARYVNKTNLKLAAKKYPGFIQVYSITGKSDRMFMHRMITDNDLIELDKLLCTPCSVDYSAFFKTPKAFSVTDKYLAELGCIRPISKPDFDNIAKKYADMYNGNVWIDDSLVIDGSIHKYYSILPRVEIKLRYMNMLFNKYQYNSVSARIQDPNIKYFNTADT